MSVRAKFFCRAKEEFADPKGCGTVKLVPVTSGSEENKTFYKWTPSGEITLMTINEAAFAGFQLGKQYYVDFTEAPE
jgi:hypothetical protein